MMQRGRIFEHTKIHVIAWCAESGGFRPIDANLLAGVGAVLQKTLPEGGICPCLCNQTGPCGRSDRLGPLGEPAMILRGEKAVLDRKLPYGDLQDFELSDFFHRWCRLVIVAAAALFVGS